jgi:poly-beta-1,6-N-acetyl-D-glucosamine synthase
MILLFFILISLLILYASALLYCATGFLKQIYFTSDNNTQEEKRFTIIICARNEEKNIGRCIKTIIDQDYDLSKIQIIVVNDASNDSTVFQAESFLKKTKLNYRIITNPHQKGKKASITYAIQYAVYENIILRDADTFTNSYTWLKSVSDFMECENADMIIGPVKLTDNVGPLWALQAIENNVLNLMSCGSAYYKKPFLASAANLIFTKTLFEKCNGFQSHSNIPSGDDVLFLEDAKKIQGVKISYLKSYEAIVETFACRSFSLLLKQKVRWAGKFKSNPNKFNLFFGLLCVLVNAAWLFSFVYAFIVPHNGGLCLIFILSKLLIDILLLFLASRFLKNQSLNLFALPVGCIYPLYACIVAIASVFMKPHWK